MLTKSEINQKKAKFDQLDLTETIAAGDESKKKRFLLFVSLFVTLGLSLIFWSYRQLQHFTFPRVSLPSLPITTNSIDSQISNLISSDSNRWNVSIYLPGRVINWSQNNYNFDYQGIQKQLLSQKSSSTFTKNFLPQGLDIKENYSESPSKISLNSLVTTPTKTVLIMVTIEGSELLQSKDKLSRLVSTIYWSLITE